MPEPSTRPTEPTQGPAPTEGQPTSIPATPEPGTFGKWPAESSWPRLFAASLGGLAGRPYGPSALAGLTVIVDPGHGGRDSGARYAEGGKPAIREADINLSVALFLAEELRFLGASVILTRTSDSWVSLHARAALTNRQVLLHHQAALEASGRDPVRLQEVRRLLALFDPVLSLNSDTYGSGGRGLMEGIGASADLRTVLDIGRQHEEIVFLSLHCNADDSPSLGGFQIYWSSNRSVYRDELAAFRDPDMKEKEPIHPAYQYYDDSTRRRLAGSVYDAFLAAAPELFPGVPNPIRSGNFAVLRECNVSAILVEMAYLTHADDRTLLQDPAFRRRLAQGLARGLHSHYCGG